jgi:hypothetical protein
VPVKPEVYSLLVPPGNVKAPSVPNVHCGPNLEVWIANEFIAWNVAVDNAGSVFNLLRSGNCKYPSEANVQKLPLELTRILAVD